MPLWLTTGAALLAHPGEDATGDIIVVSAPRCTLLRATEEFGLCKMYNNGDMEAFSYDDRDNFKDSGMLFFFSVFIWHDIKYINPFQTEDKMDTIDLFKRGKDGERSHLPGKWWRSQHTSSLGSQT